MAFSSLFCVCLVLGTVISPALSCILHGESAEDIRRNFKAYERRYNEMDVTGMRSMLMENVKYMPGNQTVVAGINGALLNNTTDKDIENVVGPKISIECEEIFTIGDGDMLSINAYNHGTRKGRAMTSWKYVDGAWKNNRVILNEIGLTDV